MKLRWCTVENKVNSELIREYSTKHQLPLMTSKDKLTDRKPTVLQFMNDNGEWETVPHVTEFRDPKIKYIKTPEWNKE